MVNTPEQQRNAENLQNNQTVEEIVIDTKKSVDSLSVEQRTKAETDALASFVNKNNRTENVDTTPEQQQLAQNIDDLLAKYQDLAKGIRSAEGSGATKRHLKHRLNENIESLKRMKKDLNKHNYQNIATYKARVDELKYYFEHYEQIRQIVVLGGRTSDIHAIIDSKQDARYAKKEEKNEARYFCSKNDILHDATLLSLWNDDLEGYDKYLEEVYNHNIEPSSHPFYARHIKSFQMIQHTSPNVYGALAPSRRGQIRYDVYCQQNGIPCNNGRFNPNRRYRTGTIGDDIASMIEDSQRRRGKEVNPQQREARRKIGNIGSVVGCVALGIGIFRELFPGKKARDAGKKTNRWKILGLGAGIYGVTHYTEIKDTVLDAFNGDPDNWVARRQSEREQRRATEQAQTQVQTNTGLSSSEASELVNAKITYPTLVATTIGNIPIKMLIEQKVLEEGNGKLTFNKNNYVACIESLAAVYGWPEDKKQRILDQISLDDAAESISNGLAYCGVKTLDDLNRLKGSSDKTTLMNSATFKNKYRAQIEEITRKTGIFSHMEEQGFLTAGLEQTLEILEKYDSNKNENEQILERLKAGLLISRDKKYKIEDMIHDPNVDLENMTMRGFTNDGGTEIPFDSYGDLFDTVRLTKRIKDNFSGRQAKSDTPFHIDELKGRIEFDDTERYELRKNETDVIKNRTLRKTSSLLTKNKKFYVNYLNKWRKEDQNRIIDENKVDLSGYPILKGTGINFTDKNEAHKSEQLLSKIKYELRHRKKTNTGDAFEITTTNYGISIKTNIKFTSIGGAEFKYNISDYPTLIKNKEKLLQYLNNPSNKMRGSEPVVHH